MGRTQASENHTLQWPTPPTLQAELPRHIATGSKDRATDTQRHSVNEPQSNRATEAPSHRIKEPQSNRATEAQSHRAEPQMHRATEPYPQPIHPPTHPPHPHPPSPSPSPSHTIHPPPPLRFFQKEKKEGTRFRVGGHMGRTQASEITLCSGPPHPHYKQSHRDT